MTEQVGGVSSLQKNKYSVFSVFCMIYCTASAGAFGVEEIVSGCGPGMTICILVGMALVWAYPVVLGTAELASIMPGEGGYYYWAKHTLGEFWGYVMGINGAVSFYVCSSTYVVMSVNYLATIIEMTQMEATIIKLVIILIFTILNLKGLKDVSIVSMIFAVCVVVLFAVVSIVGFSNWSYSPFEPFMPEGLDVISGISMGIGLGIWMYCGFGAVTLMAGEISNPQVISKAMKLAVPAAALTYLLPTAAGLVSVGQWEMWSPGETGGIGFPTVLSLGFGDAGKVIFVVVAMVAALSSFNTNMAGGSRSFFVLVDDRLFPKKWITNVTKKSGVPYVGVLSIAVVTLLMMQIEFKALVLIQVIPILVSQVLVSVIIVKARKVIPMDLRKDCYTVSGGKVGLFLITVLPAFVAVLAYYMNGMDYFLYGQIFLLLVGVTYPIAKIGLGGYSERNPELFPKNPDTKLAYGDLYRIAKYMAVIGVVSVVGYFYFDFMEGDWGPAYYAEMYGSGLLSSFDAMRMALMSGGIACIVIAVVLCVVARKKDKKIAMPTKITVSVGKHQDEG